jgi:hypothetical protein
MSYIKLLLNNPVIVHPRILSAGARYRPRNCQIRSEQVGYEHTLLNYLTPDARAV